jgi:spore cortex formation protein SpoVR/YcgB (stage V sporulation)
VQEALATKIQIPEKPWKTRKEMIEVMHAERERVGTGLYYQVLLEEGAEEAESITDAAQALRIYTTLRLMATETKNE